MYLDARDPEIVRQEGEECGNVQRVGVPRRNVCMRERRIPVDGAKIGILRIDVLRKKLPSGNDWHVVHLWLSCKADTD